MKDALTLLLPWAGGVVLGCFFFGGLWWTIRRGVNSKRPAFWFAGSLLLRMSVALAGLYWLAAGRWERLLACLLGMLIARALVKRFAGPPLTHARPATEENLNEP